MAEDNFKEQAYPQTGIEGTDVNLDANEKKFSDLLFRFNRLEGDDHRIDRMCEVKHRELRQLVTDSQFAARRETAERRADIKAIRSLLPSTTGPQTGSFTDFMQSMDKRVASLESMRWKLLAAAAALGFLAGFISMRLVG